MVLCTKNKVKEAGKLNQLKININNYNFKTYKINILEKKMFDIIN